MMNANNRKKKRNGNKNRPKNGRRRRNDANVRYIDRGRFVADRTFVKFIWNDTTVTRSSAASTNVLNFGIRSSAYDPDPAALTGSIPGFTEMANLYAAYRVRKMKANWSVANAEVNGIIIAIWPTSSISNVNSLTSSDVLEYAGNIGGKVVNLGNNNTLPRRVTTTAVSRSLFGPLANIDTAFTASTSGNPSIMFGINFAAISPFANFSYPVGSQLTVTYFIEFFERRQLET